MFNTPPVAIITFLLLRSVKYLLFLSIMLVPIHPLKPLFLLITGFIIYYIFTRIGNRIVITLIFLIENFWISLNVVYFSYFDNYFHLLNLLFHLQTNFRNAKESISFMSAVNVINWLPKLSILLVDLLGFIIYLKHFYKIKGFLETRISKITLILSILTLLTSEIVYSLKNEGIVNIILKLANEGITPKEEKKLISKYGTIFVNTLDIVYLMNENIIYKQVSNYPEIKFTKTTNKRNIILIQVESLDSSVIFTDYKGTPITPFLRHLTTNSIFFPIMVSYHFAGYTSDAEFAIINSIHPLKDIPSLRYWKNFDTSLARIFKSNNYLTYAFHNNRGHFFGRKEVYPKMGFDKFFDMDEMKLEEKGWGASDEDMFNYIKEFLKTIKTTNFFIYIITMSSHGPFTIVQNYYTNPIFSDIEDINTRNYFNSINYVDKSLSNFVNFVKKEIPNTIIFIFGDHHSSVQDSNLYRRSIAVVENKIIEIVPLFIVPSSSCTLPLQNTQIDVPISQLSIPPTVMQLSGIEGKIRTKGIPLLPLPPNATTIFYLGEDIEVTKIKQNLNFSITNYSPPLAKKNKLRKNNFHHQSIP